MMERLFYFIDAYMNHAIYKAIECRAGAKINTQ